MGRRGRRVARWALAVFFVVAGLGHFLNPGFYLRIVPPYLPAPLALVYLSGVAEVAGGIGVLLPSLRSAAGWGLVALLIAVFPANLHMALHPDLYPEVDDWILYARLPLQAAFIFWAYAATRPDSARPAPGPGRR